MPLKVRKGSVRTRTTVGRSGTPKNKHKLRTKQKDLPGPGPSQILAYVSVQAGGTFTDGNYNSVRVSVDVNLPVVLEAAFEMDEEFDKEPIDQAVLKAMEIAAEHYEREAEEIREVLGISKD